MSYQDEEHMPSVERLRELLVGRKVVEARLTSDYDPKGYLTLDDGTVLKLWGNDGGCGCSSGCYPLTELNACDNVITNVEVDERPEDDYSSGEGHYRIFVFAEDRRLLANFDGTDGNGYYGTGWWLEVERQAAPQETGA